MDIVGISRPPNESEKIETASLFDSMLIGEYHRRKDWLSKTSLNYLADNPARYRAWLDGVIKDKPSDSMRTGAAAHAYVNERPQFDGMYHIMAEGVTRDLRHNDYKAEISAANGRELLKPAELEGVKRIGEALMADPRGKILLSVESKIESSFFWTSDDGIKKKARPDVLRFDDVVVDLKVTNSVEPEEFYKTSWNLGYDLSVAITAEGFEAFHGRPLQGYCFLAIEKDPPYLVEVFDAFAEFQTGMSYKSIGEYRLENLVATYRQCKKSGKWPGYSTAVQPMRVPSWQLSKLKGFV